MTEHNSINFRNLDCFEDIKYSTIFQSAQSENLIKIGSIFDKNKNGMLDIGEISALLNQIDFGKDGSDRIITEKEIKKFCKNYNKINKENQIEYSAMDEFLSGIQSNMQKVEKQSYSIDSKSVQFDVGELFTKTYSGFSLIQKKYENGFIKYFTEINKTSKSTNKHSALYDTKNDKFISKNGNSSIEISGLKKYLATGANAKADMPILTVTDENGKKIDIEIQLSDLDLYRYGSVNFSDNKEQEPEFKLMYSMTNLISSVSNLESEVLSDLVNNVKTIQIDRLDYNAAGQTNAYDEKSTDYYEKLYLDASEGVNRDVLTHEIGHTVDANVQGWISDENGLKEIVQKIKADPNLSYKIKDYSYMLSDEKEFYAEWYTYKHNKKSNLPETNELMKYLQKRSDWPQIEEKLEKVKQASIDKTNDFYKGVKKPFEDADANNNLKAAITDEQISKYSIEQLRNKLNVRNKNSIGPLTRIENLLKTQYPSYYSVYCSKGIEEQIEDIVRLRNIPVIKTELQNVMKAIDRENSIGYKEALSQFATKCRKDIKPNRPMRKDLLLSTIQKSGHKSVKDLFDLKIVNENYDCTLRELFDSFMTENDDIPQKIKDEYAKSGLTEEIFWSFINYDSVYFYAVDFFNGKISY